MSSPLIAVSAKRRPYKKNLVAVGLVLLALGAYTIYDSNSVSSYHSTFNILPSKFFKIMDNLKDSATISGQIKESSGRPITFLIMSSLQYAAYQTKQGNASLYAVIDTPSASISFTFPSPDSYFLMFLHGSGYLSTTETVDFQRSYAALGRFELYSGIGLLGIAVLQLYWGLRPSEKPRPRALLKETETLHGQP